MNEPPPENPASDVPEDDLDVNRIFSELAGESPDEYINFGATFDELHVLAEHAANVFRLGEEDRLLFARESNHHYSALDLLDRLEKVLGSEVINNLWERIDAETRRRLGPELSHIFHHGNAAEREQVLAELNAKGVYIYKKLTDKKTQAKALAFLRDNPSGAFRDNAGDLWTLTDRWLGVATENPTLSMLLTTRHHGSSHLPDKVIERPADWVAPYGLGAG